MRWMMKELVPYLGVVLFVFLLGYQCRRFGNEWVFDATGVPIPVFGADAAHHPDGTLINPVELQLLRSGYRRGFYYFCYLTVLVGLVVIIMTSRKSYLLQKEVALNRAMLQSLKLKGSHDRGD
jgi:hypothetical protein